MYDLFAHQRDGVLPAFERDKDEDDRMDKGSKTSAANGAHSASERLNQACFCITLDRDALGRALEQEVGDPDFYATFISTRPHLFSDASVFISRSQASEMLRIVRAIEAATGLAGYQDMALSWAPDFHLTAAGPKLIEVNTNAGGAFLNLSLIHI